MQLVNKADTEGTSPGRFYIVSALLLPLLLSPLSFAARCPVWPLTVTTWGCCGLPGKRHASPGCQRRGYIQKGCCRTVRSALHLVPHLRMQAFKRCAVDVRTCCNCEHRNLALHAPQRGVAGKSFEKLSCHGVSKVLAFHRHLQGDLLSLRRHQAAQGLVRVQLPPPAQPLE